MFLSYTHVHAGRWCRASPRSSAATAARRSIRRTEQILLTVDQPETITTAATSPSGRTVICTSASATAAAAATAAIGNGHAHDAARQAAAHRRRRRATPTRFPATNPFARSQRRQSMSGSRSRQRRLPGDLRVWLPQSVALEFRSRERRAVARRRRPGRLGGSRPVTLGGNYGWRCREGAHDFNPRRLRRRRLYRSGRRIRPHARQLHHRRLCLSRHADRRWPAAICSATSARDASGPGSPRTRRSRASRRSCSTPRLNISSFGQGNDGELYVVNYGGTLHRLVFQAGAGGGTAPATLSATGCVIASNPTAAGGGTDSVRDQRAVLVRRREQGSLARAAGRSEHHRAAPTATGTSRTARC